MDSDEQQYCCSCRMWLNGPLQYDDHQKGIKHRKIVKRIADPSKVILKIQRDKGVVAQRNTVFLIGQSALSKDSKDHAMLYLYATAALKAKM